MNRTILKQTPGVSRTNFSPDSFEPGVAETEGTAETYPTEFLNNLEPQGLSIHQLELKVGAPVTRIFIFSWFS